MSTTSKVVIGIIILVIIGVGIWYVASPGSQSPQAIQQVTYPSSNTTTATSSDNSSGQVPESGLTTSSSDNSNAALNSDLTSINGQMNGLNSDSAAANQSTQ